MSLIENLEEYIEQLKREPGPEVFKIRRKLEGIRATYLKNGNAIAVLKEFELHCEVCGLSMVRQDDYYLHLRKTHNMTDDEAAKETTKPRMGYESALQQLEALLTEFTDYYLEEQNGS